MKAFPNSSNFFFPFAHLDLFKRNPFNFLNLHGNATETTIANPSRPYQIEPFAFAALEGLDGFAKAALIRFESERGVSHDFGVGDSFVVRTA